MTDTTVKTNQITDATIRKSKVSKIVGKILVYAVLIFYAIIILFPFSIVLLTSFKNFRDASSIEFIWIPEGGFVIDGYIEALNYPEFGDYSALINGFFNTLFYILPPTIIGLFASAMSAYAFSKLRFRLRNIMYTVLLATMMIPGTITIASTFSIYDAIGWVNTPLPLMIPGMFGAAACVFFMRQFFAGIPDSLIEAAKLDGLGFIGIFFQIMVPLSVPALLAQGLLGFIGGYNDYFGPLIYLQSNELYSLQIALSVFANVYGDEQNVVMAGTIIALIPTLIIYFIAQDFFIEGIATSGIKG